MQRFLSAVKALVVALKRGKGWRRLGTVCSVGWILGAVGWVAVERLGTPPYRYHEFWTVEVVLDSAQQRAELENPFVRLLPRSAAEDRRYIRANPEVETAWNLKLGLVVQLTLAPVAVGWLLACVLVFTARWVIAGFTGPPRPGE